MTSYDENIIQTAADALYRHAASIVLTSTILGVILGLILGAFVANATSLGGFAFLGGAVLGGYIGWSRAQSAAFLLRLQAQTALCQVQIEKNTRPAAGQSRLAADMPTPIGAPVRIASLPATLQTRAPAKAHSLFRRR
jgi:hypothetical protein